GLKMMVKGPGGTNLMDLQNTTLQIVEEGNQTEGLTGLFTGFRADTPWLHLEINRQDAKMKGVSMSEVFSALQVYFGSLYINDFNRFGRTWQVNVQADANFRQRMENLGRL